MADPFQANLKQWAQKFSVSMDALARQTCQEVSSLVVNGTPVDTGFLRSSWQPSIGEPITTEGNGDAVSTVALVCADVKAGDTYWMTNNAAYARRIEYGFVGQDSLGRTYNQRGRFMVTSAMEKAQQVVEDLAKELAP